MRSKQKALQTLRGKFLRITIPLIFLSVAGVFSVIELLAHRTSVDQLQQTLKGIIRTQAAALSNPVWNLDRDQILLSLQAVVTNLEIFSATVFDEKGNVMSAAGSVPDNASPSELIPLSQDILYNAGNGDRMIGALELIATRQFVRENTRKRLVIAAVVALVAVSIEVASALFALRRIVGQPLQRLLSSIDEKRTAASPKKVIWNSTDELGQVINAYNQMQTRQQDYETELRSARDTFEERVIERTEELAIKSRQMEQLSSQLAKYLSPQIYDSIFSGSQKVVRTSARKKLTVFFSDIVAFTETADRMESEELTQLLNRYLTEMSQIAFEHGATIDKYVGDAIMIFFGDPETKGVQQDALACVRMAIEMQRRMRELADIWRQSGIEKPLQVRMGINTGYCTVGNFGSDDRLDYTIIGGAVNTAARLEAIAPPGGILISYETYALVSEEICCRERDKVEVKGIAYPISTYQVVDTVDVDQRETGHFYESLPSLTIKFNTNQMTSDERDKAASILQQALKQLSCEDRTTGDPRRDQDG
ncbi:hypothetical protein DL239_16235 [Sedimentitalea sp. CY04]|uniref:Guanylate cyclase domain-containing protein n=1 Tax=Parasedimentitalea denitrificans TaxID=2211118 RepID=A0ABX0WE35_9RHOB|nr:adenylate/guanylate cyclase domain-containing protein [Sedimentitalea sp. CY04]NIZ62521.1 hypothetical protein [Sedimentitalea sp. CY04]